MLLYPVSYFKLILGMYCEAFPIWPKSVDDVAKCVSTRPYVSNFLQHRYLSAALLYCFSL